MATQTLSKQQVENLQKKLETDQTTFIEIKTHFLDALPNANDTQQTTLEKLGEALSKFCRDLLRENTSESGAIDQNTQDAYKATLDCLISYLDVMYRAGLLSIEQLQNILYHYTVRIIDEYQYTNAPKEGDA